MKKFINLNIFIVICLLIFTGTGFAKSEAEIFLKEKIDSAVRILENKKLAADAKQKELANVVDNAINFQLMSKLTMKKYWRTMSKKQQNKFTGLFKSLLYDTYLKKLPFYSNERIIYKPVVKINSKKFYIPTVIKGQTDNYSVVYKLYRSKQGWQVYDIEVQGISMIKSYKKQFEKTVQNKSVKHLFIKMAEKK